LSTKLVIGANGFLGSHVTRQLLADGHEVRAMVRPNATTIGIDDLPVTRHHGDIWDNDTLREAMAGVDDVYYCVVDTRGWLRDPTPLFHTNVEGTRNVLEVAKYANLQKFVFTSSYVTVGRRRGHRASEDDVIVDRGLTPYVRSRVQAENIVLKYAKEQGLPAVAMCVSTTYGSGDWGRTPHGAIIAGAAFGKLPFVMDGIELEAVGVEDAARAMILAADRGRIGERYLISEKMISNADVVCIAAEAAVSSSSHQVNSAPDVICTGRGGQHQGEAARHRRAAFTGVIATHASRSASRPQQGGPRIGLGTKAG
jgi:dihydroflavonol-4-reductase